MPYYGMLGVKDLNREVYRIWLSRDSELDELPRKGWSFQLQTDPDLLLVCDYICRLVQATNLTEREHHVIFRVIVDEATHQEVAEELDCTQSRVLQILNKGLRRLRTAAVHSSVQLEPTLVEHPDVQPLHRSRKVGHPRSEHRCAP